jgi:diacylglycerol diphosphate phosphatase/phosphatidate phosphatase|tara:strand:- start:233 stop:1117 length:885 start_codon:yes stop_codon:yes gene_type:complete
MENDTLLHSGVRSEQAAWTKPTSTLHMLLLRHSVGDWAATIAIGAIGFYLDKAAPFVRDITPQLHDPSISYPHTPGHQARVPSWLLWHLCFTFPLGVICVAHILGAGGARRLQSFNQAALGLCSSIAVTLTIVCIVKNGYGRLRPDFLARCEPVDGVCTGDARVIQEGRKSFPSGHTALSYAGLGYLSCFLWAELLHSQCHTLRLAGDLSKLLIASLPWMAALCIGLSRIEDYWHHWEDVSAGLLLGNFVAYTMYRLRYPRLSMGSEALALNYSFGHIGQPGKTKALADARSCV